MGPSKAEDESRRARKYENTKGAGISEGGIIGQETWRSGATAGSETRPNKKVVGRRREGRRPAANKEM